MTQENLDNLENNETPKIIPEKAKEKEISPEEFYELAKVEEQKFKEETYEQMGELNTMDIDHATFEKIWGEENIDQKMVDINSEVEKTIKLFKPKEKFIKHIDERHEEKILKEGFDFEYQKEFSSFFQDILKKANVEINSSLSDSLEPHEDNGESGATKSVYIDTSFNFRDGFNLEKSVWKRLDIDKQIVEKFSNEKEEAEETNQAIDYVDLNNRITNAYREKVNFKELLSYLDDPSIDQAKKNLLIIILQVMDPNCIPKRDEKCSVDEADSEPFAIGRCIMAEKHTLAYISGENIKAKANGGYMNLITDNNGLPIMIEKMNLGDSHSCTTLEPIRLGGKYIPPGSILQAIPDDFEPIRHKMQWFSKRKGAFNYVTKIDNYKGFKFSRFSILSVPPEIRSSASGEYYLHQQNKTKGYINYDWITPEIITEHAKERLKR